MGKHGPEGESQDGQVQPSMEQAGYYAALTKKSRAADATEPDEHKRIVDAAGERADARLAAAQEYLTEVTTEPIGGERDQQREQDQVHGAVGRQVAIAEDWADRRDRELTKVYPVGHPLAGAEPGPEGERLPSAAELFGQKSTAEVQGLEQSFAAFAGAPRRAKAVSYRQEGDDFMAQTHDRDAARMERAGKLMGRMVHNKFLAQETEYRHHLQRPDREQATMEVMAKAGLHHLRRAERAASKGDEAKARKLRGKARWAMGEAMMRADNGVDASSLVKKPWQVWR